MTKEQIHTNEKIEVMTAFLEGKLIESQTAEGAIGWCVNHHPTWDWYNYNFRIAKPAPREFWILSTSRRNSLHPTWADADRYSAGLTVLDRRGYRIFLVREVVADLEESCHC